MPPPHPTRPVIRLMSRAKRWGSSWKTEPLHMPKAPEATKKAPPQIQRLLKRAATIMATAATL